jgi:hypothetical protein
MSELPAPLVPAEIDLRSFKSMPLEGNRLFKSDTWIMCTSEERVAALRLWWASWHQEPAASLPSSDQLLAELAGYGVAVKAFLKVKANAMRGWIKCADGRLYHHVVAEIALESWAKKRAKTTENAADRDRKRRKREAQRNGVHQDTPPVPPGQPAEHPSDNGHVSAGNPAGNALKEKGIEVEGEKESKQDAPSGASPPKRGSRLPKDWQPSEANRNYAIANMLTDAQIAREVERFRNYWHAKPGKDGVKLDWDATWRNWIIGAVERQPTVKPTRQAITPMGPAGG